MKTGIELIAKEREQQVKKHGFTSDEDREYNEEQLKKAAVYTLTLERKYYPEDWEFWFHDNLAKKALRMSEHDFYLERLIIAGALIAAEIDRLNEDTQ